jgi:hypothetical protein
MAAVVAHHGAAVFLLWLAAAVFLSSAVVSLIGRAWSLALLAAGLVCVAAAFAVVT